MDNNGYIDDNGYTKDNYALNVDDINNYNNNLNNFNAMNGVKNNEINDAIKINRTAIDYDDLNAKYGKIIAQPVTFKRIAKKKSEKFKKQFSWLETFLSFFPILTWMRNYKIKDYLLNDIIAGFTVSILTIPQGMANGILSGVTPIEGLYVSFFPVVIYCFMGTSHHMSMGTFSIMSIMVSEAAAAINGGQEPDSGSNRTDAITFEEEEVYSNFDILTSLALLCGIIQCCMGLLSLGKMSVLLSDTLVSALQTAAAIHVATSQVPSVFNIRIPRTKTRFFKLIHDWINIVKYLDGTNWVTAVISACAFVALMGTKEYIEPKLKEKYARLKNMVIPIDIIVVITITLISWQMELDVNRGVDVVEEIPLGFPSPIMPRVVIFPKLIMDAVVITIVIYSIQQSLAQTFAKKYNYKTDPNQELIAMGTGNIFGSFFRCFPVAPALSRCSVLDRVGGKTQMAKIVSCIILAIVLLVVGPLLYYLPKCILGTIIIVALKSMFMKVKDFPKALRVSILEGLTWIVTFVSVICFDVDLGLLIGIIFALFVLLIRLSTPSSLILGQLPNSELYANIKMYKGAQEIEGMKIFHFNCALFFINRQVFKDDLYRKVFDLKNNRIPINESMAKNIHTVIIDCSSIFYIDTSGVDTIVEVISELNRIGIHTVLASCNMTLMKMFEKMQIFDLFPEHTKLVLASVQDAVARCHSHQLPLDSHYL